MNRLAIAITGAALVVTNRVRATDDDVDLQSTAPVARLCGQGIACDEQAEPGRQLRLWHAYTGEVMSGLKAVARNELHPPLLRHRVVMPTT